MALALCDRCPCSASLHPPQAALGFAAFDKILRQTAHSSLTLLAHNLPQNFPVCVAAVGTCPPTATFLTFSTVCVVGHSPCPGVQNNAPSGPGTTHSPGYSARSAACAAAAPPPGQKLPHSAPPCISSRRSA